MKKVKRSSSSNPKLPALHRLIRDMSSDAYHGTGGTWSSSQLKDILDDEDVFIKKYVLREVPRVEREAFDTGTYFHTGVLEPHKMKKEIAVYEGKTRYGKKWDRFKLENKGKMVVTTAQAEQGDRMIEAVKNSPIAMQYLQGEPELSLFVELAITTDGTILAPFFNKVLTPTGWDDMGSEDTQRLSKKAYKTILKVRADCLGDSFVSDLKSTSGSAKKEHSVKDSISRYQYDLSAALYLDLFSLMRPEVDRFIWIFATKVSSGEISTAATWQASPRNILIGRAKWSRAVKRLAELHGAGWEVADYLRVAEPNHYELNWLVERDIDLL